MWCLKENNCYYTDIIIDNKVLESLPINNSIDNQLQHTIVKDFDDENEDDVITHTFVPLPPSNHHKDVTIKNALDCM